MDFLYINTIINEAYYDLPSLRPFPDGVSRAVHAATNDSFLDSDRVDSCYSLFTVRSEYDPNATPILVFSKSAKQTSSASVGRYVQSVGWQWDENLLRAGLNSPLEAGFYSEAEVQQMAISRQPIQVPERIPTTLTPMEVHPDPRALQAIMTGIILRWVKGTDPVRISVPRDVDYNSYVFGAIRAIYDRLPLAMRMQAGFCSFAAGLRNIPKNIYICFVPEEQADNQVIPLDCSNLIAVEKALIRGTQRPKWDKFLAYLSTVEPENMPKFLACVNRDAEGGISGMDLGRRLYKMDPKVYLPFGDALILRDLDGTVDEMLPEWNRYLEHPEKFPKSMQGVVTRRVGEQAQPEKICRWLLSDTPEEMLERTKSLMTLCTAYEALCEPVWNGLVSGLRGLDVSFAEIHRLVKAERSLAPIVNDDRMDALLEGQLRLDFEALQAQPVDTLEAADTCRQTAAALERKATAENRTKLLTGIREYMTGLRGIRQHLQLEGHDVSLKKLMAAPIQTAAEADNLLAQTESLSRLVSAEPESEGKQELLDRIAGFMVQLRQQKLQAMSAEMEHIRSLPQTGMTQIAAAMEQMTALRGRIAAEPDCDERKALLEKAEAYFVQANAQKLQILSSELKALCSLSQSTIPEMNIALNRAAVLFGRLNNEPESEGKQKLTGELRQFANEAYERKTSALMAELEAIRILPRGSIPEVDANIEKVAILEKRALQELNLDTNGRKQLLGNIAEFRQTLEGEKAQVLRHELDEIRTMPLESIPQIDEAVAAAQKLQDRANRVLEGEAARSLIDEIGQYITDANNQKIDTDLYYNEILEKLQQAPSYYAAVNVLRGYEKDPQFKSLKEDKRQSLADYVKTGRRAGSFAEYEAAFQSHFGGPLTVPTLNALNRKSPEDCALVLEDLAAFRQVQYQLPVRQPARAILAELQAVHAKANALLGENAEVQILMDGVPQPEKLVVDTLMLQGIEQNKELFDSFCRRGLYDGTDLLQKVSQMQQSGAKMRWLFPFLMGGAFSNTGREQYLAALEMMIANTENKVRACEILNEERGKLSYADPAADAALAALWERHKPAPQPVVERIYVEPKVVGIGPGSEMPEEFIPKTRKGPKLTLILGIVAAALLLIGGAVAAILLLGGKDEEKPLPLTPETTQASESTEASSEPETTAAETVTEPETTEARNAAEPDSDEDPEYTEADSNENPDFTEAETGETQPDADDEDEAAGNSPDKLG